MTNSARVIDARQGNRMNQRRKQNGKGSKTLNGFNNIQ